MHLNLGEKNGEKPQTIYFIISWGLLMTRKQAILSIEGGYYCFVLAYGINLCKVSQSSEYVCTKSIVLLCLLK